jgi:FixJ family two-component response regulator
MSGAIRPFVAVVDDDDSVRESLSDLLRECGYDAQAFASAEDFLASDCLGSAGCILLDVAMPGMTGPELQRELSRLDAGIPIIFMTSTVNAGARRRILEAGAVECLLKPFTEEALLAALRVALREA